MTQVTQALYNSVFTPKAVLVAYANDSHDYFLETRSILKDGTMGVGKPVTRRFLNGMLSRFSVTYAQTPMGRMPANLLYADTRPGNERYVWWEPAQKRHQAFAKGLAIPDGEYPMPAVVYMVRNDDLYVYAIKDRKPKDGTRLHRGPFFNYYEDGRVCLGDAKVELPNPLTWDALLQSWQRLFWNSVNVHLMNYGNPVKGNLTSVLKEHRDRDAFDNSLLVPIKKCISDLYDESRR